MPIVSGLMRLRSLVSTVAIAAIATLSGAIVPDRATAQAVFQPGAASPARSASLDAVEFCPDDLQVSLNQIIQRPTFSQALWGVAITSLETNEVLYSHNADQFLIPASNIKLLTTAAALRTARFSPPQDWSAFQNWIVITNRDSNNAYADALLRRFGGPNWVKETLMSLGVDPNSYRQVDGSGLSRYNMAKPTTFISVLEGMQRAEGRDLFYASLPIGGHSGTLRNRFRGTTAQGLVHAKTGTLNGVRALSGYFEHPLQGTLAFSIMVNQPNQSGTVMIQAIDQMVLNMAALDACDRP